MLVINPEGHVFCEGVQMDPLGFAGDPQISTAEDKSAENLMLKGRGDGPEESIIPKNQKEKKKKKSNLCMPW